MYRACDLTAERVKGIYISTSRPSLCMVFTRASILNTDTDERMTLKQRAWEFITSVKLTIVLLSGIGLMIVAGTYVESTQGNQAAVAIIYRSIFMDAMVALLGINQITCTIKRYPYNPHQAGWLLTHVGVLVILVGSIYGRRGTLDGHLVLPENGYATEFIIEEDTRDGVKRLAVPLDFRVELIDFEVQNYPGTQQASLYNSHIRLVDESKNIAREQNVRVNYPLNHNGFVIAQQSFFTENGVQHSVFSVLKNPGTPMVFSGFIILSAGILLVVFVKPWLRKKFPPEVKPSRAVTVVPDDEPSDAAPAQAVPMESKG
ncbi:hypothetical protein GF324_01800 [bacterium]|nr:hypothetical protein [bacterium]